MNIIDRFRNRESERIEVLFAKADRLSEGQIDELVRYCLVTFFETGPGGSFIAAELIKKINRVMGIGFMPTRGSYDTWHAHFIALPAEKKRCLLVTLCNDICRMNVMDESALMLKIDEVLKDIDGFMRGDRTL